jgi:hypothetical protein
MAVEVIVSSSKFFNQIKNGADFSQNTGDFTFNLAGCVGEKIKCETIIDTRWFAQATDFNQFTIDEVSGRVTRQSGIWADDGIATGDSTDFDNTPHWFINSVSILFVNGNILYVDPADVVGKGGSYTGLAIRGKTPIRGMIYSFNLIENSENFNTFSKVTGNEQAFYASDIGAGSPRSTTPVNMTQAGNYRDWVSGSIKVSYVSTTGYFQKFKIEHEFILLPYYIDGQLVNIQNNLLPDLFTGTNSLKYSFSIELRTALSNPNSKKLGIVDSILGSTAYFGENFNGLSPNYQIDSYNYKDTVTSAGADGILTASKCTTTIICNRLTGNFSSNNYVNIFISYLPNEDEYTNTLSTYEDNFLYDNILCQVGSTNTGTGIIKSISCQIVGTQLKIEIETEYTPLQQLRIDSDKFYVIGVQIADNTLSSAVSDKLTFSIVNNYDKSADIDGLMRVNLFEIYSHTKTIGIDSPTTDIDQFVQDGILARFRIGLYQPQDAFLNALEFLLIAYNSSNNNYFVLDSFQFAISGSIMSNYIQQLSINSNRGYKLADVDQFNRVVLEYQNSAGGWNNYGVQIGQKFSWQDWIAQLDADSIFFDFLKQNNGLNKNSANYSNINGYDIRIGLLANVTGINILGHSGVTDYLFLSPKLDILDENSANIISGTISTYSTTNVNIGGAILNDENTIIKAKFTNTSTPFTDINGFYGIIRIEENNQQGFNINELSTVRQYPENNILIPINGQSLCKIELIGNEIILTCQVDYQAITKNIRYNISARLGDGSGIIAGAKITEEDGYKLDEDGNIKIVE